MRKATPPSPMPEAGMIYSKSYIINSIKCIVHMTARTDRNRVVNWGCGERKKKESKGGYPTSTGINGNMTRTWRGAGGDIHLAHLLLQKESSGFWINHVPSHTPQFSFWMADVALPFLKCHQSSPRAGDEWVENNTQTWSVLTLFSLLCSPLRIWFQHFEVG